MKNTFHVTLNDQIIYTYTKKTLPARLRRFLDEIDEKMSFEIRMPESIINNPNKIQKLQYVAMSLFNAIESNDTNLQEVMSAYLLSNHPALNEICIIEKNEIINLELK